MDFLSSLIDDLWDSLKAVFRRSKDAYDGSGRFARWRLWVMAALLADVGIAVAVFIVVGLQALQLDAWYQPSFPSDLVIVRNQGEALGPTEIVLDGQYTLQTESIDRGVNAFEVERRFRNAKSERPQPAYRPKKMVLQTAGDRVELDVRTSK